jgi:hypothetical protein
MMSGFFLLSRQKKNPGKQCPDVRWYKIFSSPKHGRLQLVVLLQLRHRRHRILPRNLRQVKKPVRILLEVFLQCNNRKSIFRFKNVKGTITMERNIPWFPRWILYHRPWCRCGTAPPSSPSPAIAPSPAPSGGRCRSTGEQ